MRILRRSFYSAAAVSTLLLLATLILWPVSYRYEVFAKHERPYVDKSAPDLTLGEKYDVLFFSGRVWLIHMLFVGPPESRIKVGGTKLDAGEIDIWSYLTWNTPDPNRPPGVEFLGIVSQRLSPTTITLYIPLSYFTLLFSILPLLAFRSIRRRRRAGRVGLCPKCGYDLRAQRAGSGGAVCPECGTPVAGRGPSPGGGGRP